jgi:hypothetical protein
MLTHLDRIVNDGSNREAWLASRRGRVGASTAAKFSKASSVDLYVADMLNDRSWGGNEFTRSGHRWEPMMLAWAGIPQNVALFHSPDDTDHVATPDGLTTGRIRLAECKAKHDRIVTGPTLAEWRQVAWQFLVLPEAEECEFIWAEVVNGRLRGDEPKSITIAHTDPKVIELQNLILPIAREVLERYRAALDFQKELSAA